MIIKQEELLGRECIIWDVVAYSMRADDVTVYDYEKEGRQKHLLFYQTEDERYYTRGDDHIATLSLKDVIFLPHGAKYLSRTADGQKSSSGIGISFRLQTPDGEPLLFDENNIILKHDCDGKLLGHFKSVLSRIMTPAKNSLRICGEISILLDEMFSDTEGQERRSRDFKDIKAAVRTIEREPWKNLTVAELAALCCMSESTFLRKFKRFSGGVSPIKYRNNIRLILAEELAASEMTLEEIAEKLGFYDSTHLCKLYRKHKGEKLKK